MKQPRDLRRDVLVMTVFAVAFLVLVAIFYARNRAGQNPLMPRTTNSQRP